MAQMEFQFRPLERWPRPETPVEQRKGSPFKTSLVKTLRALAYEMSRIGGINPIFITTAHSEREIRIDGLPRGDVRPPKFPGVIVEFMARPGRLVFACDTCRKWEDNLHAITLTMEWLRAVDRYGAAGGSQQYAGFKALPPPGKTITLEDAAVFVANEGGGVPFAQLLASAETYRAAYRRAAAKLHPDGGAHDPKKWADLQQAQALLDDHHNPR